MERKWSGARLFNRSIGERHLRHLTARHGRKLRKLHAPIEPRTLGRCQHHLRVVDRLAVLPCKWRHGRRYNGCFNTIGKLAGSADNRHCKYNRYGTSKSLRSCFGFPIGVRGRGIFNPKKTVLSHGSGHLVCPEHFFAEWTFIDQSPNEFHKKV